MQALWMIVAALLFTLMGVCIKYAGDNFNSAEILFYRGVIGIAFMWGFARMEGVSLRTTVAGMHAWRSFIGIISLGAWFYSIIHLPLATANALNYMSSVWIALFVIAGALLAWVPSRSGPPPVHAVLVLSVLAGFAGVVLVLRPDLPSEQLFAGLVGVFSSITAALVYVQVVALAKAGEPETRTVFYFAVGCAVGGALWMLVLGVSPWSWRAAVWLLPIGVLAALGQWCMTRAYSDTGGGGIGTLVVANLQYTGILFAAILGYWLLGEIIPMIGWLGILLIVGSGIVSTVLRVRSIPESPAEER